MQLSKRTFLSALNLIGAFVLGQGSLFLTSSYFLYIHRHDVVSELGLAASLCSLVVWIADLGGVYILNSHIKGRKKESVRDFFWMRIGVVSVVVLMGLVVSTFYRTIELHLPGYVIFLLAISSCFGFAGLYDGIGKTGHVALYGSLAWVFSSALTLLFFDSSKWSIGELVGIGFSAGQWVYSLKTLRLAKALRAFAWPGSCLRIYSEFKAAVVYVSSYVAGQVYARVLLFGAIGLLDVRSAGYFVYARQIYNAVSQVVLFVRRSEGVGRATGTAWQYVLGGRHSLYFSAALSVAILFLVLLANALIELPFMISVLGVTSAICLFVWTFLNGFFFYFLAVKKLHLYLMVHGAGMAAMVTVVSLSTSEIIPFLPGVEAFVLLIEIAFLVLISRRLV